jgi:hypothetical protein
LPWKDGRLRVVWSNGKDAFTYWEPDTYEKNEDLVLAIAGATGVSSGAAHTVSALLMEDIGGLNLTDFTHLVVVDEEQFEGHLCYHIKGTHPSGDPSYDLWIGKQDYLLRKLKTESKSAGYSTTEEEIHRNIKTNLPISEHTFDFKPRIALNSERETKPAGEPNGLLSDEAPTWSEFTSDEGRFKLLMPRAPESQTLTIETAKGKIVHHSFVSTKGWITCLIDYADMPRDFVDPSNLKELFDQARDEFLREAQAKLASETQISLDGHPGREIKFNIYGGEGTLRFYMVGERFYQLGIIISDLSDKSTAEIDKFFTSFKIIPSTKPVATNCVKDTKTSPQTRFSVFRAMREKATLAWDTRSAVAELITDKLWRAGIRLARPRPYP